MTTRTEDRAILAMAFPVEIQTGEASVTVWRDIIIDHDTMDGSWCFNVYQADHDNGGGIRVEDPEMVAFFDRLHRLFIDPDGFGSQDHPDTA